MSDYKKIAYQIRCLQRAVCNISQNGGAGVNEILMTTTDVGGTPVATGYKFAINTTNGSLYLNNGGIWELVPIGNSSNSDATYLIDGSIIWNGGFSISTTELNYKILGVDYTAAPTNLTISAADLTNPRYTVVYADTSGNVGMVDGTPSTPADIPQVDAMTQIVLGVYYIPVGSTEPEGLQKVNIYKENTEWTVTGTITGLDPNYTTNPFDGTKSLLLPQFTSSKYVEFTSAIPITIGNYTNMYFRHRQNTAQISGARLRFSWYNNTTLISTSTVDILNGDWGINPTKVNTWQFGSIPLALFNFNSTAVNKLRITQIGNNGGNTQLDEIEINSLAGTQPISTQFLPGSVAYGGANGQLTQDNPGFTYNAAARTLQVGQGGFSDTSSVSLAGGRAILRGSGTGFTLLATNGSTPDASKSFMIINGPGGNLNPAVNPGSGYSRDWVRFTMGDTGNPFSDPMYAIFNSHIRARLNNTFDIGSTSQKFKKGWFTELEAGKITAPTSQVITLDNIPDSGGLVLGRNSSANNELRWIDAGTVPDEVIETESASYALVLGDKNKLKLIDVATPNTLTVNATTLSSWAIGSKVKIVQYGVGQTEIVATGGATIISAGGALKLTTRYSSAELVKITSTEFLLIGDLTT